MSPLLYETSEALNLEFSGLSSLKNPRARNWAYLHFSSTRTPIILSTCVFHVCLRIRRAAVFVFLAGIDVCGYFLILSALRHITAGDHGGYGCFVSAPLSLEALHSSISPRRPVRDGLDVYLGARGSMLIR